MPGMASGMRAPVPQLQPPHPPSLRSPLQYAFVTYARPEDAAAAIEQAHGVPVPELNPLQGAPIKVQYSLGPGAKNGSGSGSSEGRGRATHSSREARGGTVSGGSGGGGWDSGAAGGGSGDAAEHW